jgi:hypothetical protein
MAEFINLEEAVKLTHAFQDSEIGKNQTISAIFEKDIFEKILNQNGCEGINIYTSMNDEGKITFVLVGYDQDKKDMTEGLLADRANLCPDECWDLKSPLKSL